MKSLRELFRIGFGPSSSHTIGVGRACEEFLRVVPDAKNYIITLYASLAMTGRGHGTHEVIKRTFGERKIKIIFDEETLDIPHPNTFDIKTHGKFARFISTGGGAFEVDHCKTNFQIHGDEIHAKDIYPHSSFSAISQYCKIKKISLCS